MTHPTSHLMDWAIFRDIFLEKALLPKCNYNIDPGQYQPESHDPKISSVLTGTAVDMGQALVHSELKPLLLHLGRVQSEAPATFLVLYALVSSIPQ